MFPLSCARAHRLQRLRTQINLLHTNIFLHSHIVVDHKSTIVSQTKNILETHQFWVRTFFFLVFTKFRTQKPLDFGWGPFLFGPYLKSDTKIASDFEHKILGEFPEKVCTHQNFCAQRAQKIRGNIVKRCLSVNNDDYSNSVQRYQQQQYNIETVLHDIKWFFVLTLAQVFNSFWCRGWLS